MYRSSVSYTLILLQCLVVKLKSWTRWCSAQFKSCSRTSFRHFVDTVSRALSSQCIQCHEFWRTGELQPQTYNNIYWLYLKTENTTPNSCFNGLYIESPLFSDKPNSSPTASSSPWLLARQTQRRKSFPRTPRR